MYNYTAFDENNKKLDATINYIVEGGVFTYFLKARGGNKKTGINLEYSEALEALIRENKFRNYILEDILVDSKTVQDLSTSERRVNLPEFPFPIELAKVNDISAFRKAIGNLVKEIGKDPAATGGNGNKKLLLRFSERSLKDTSQFSRQVLKPFNKRQYTNSGPPPSQKRRGSTHNLDAIGFTYIFKLKGLGLDALKIGYTKDLARRFKELNDGLHSSITKISWIEHTYWEKPTLNDAYDFEQKLHKYFEQYKYPNETEIFQLSVERFDQLMKKFEF